MSRVGMVLEGKYEILKKIGQGGMSVVYVAMDTRLNKQWAVKEISSNDVKNTKILLKSLQTEADILKMVDHPVLPRIVDIIKHKGSVFVVMDYIEGRTLSEIIKEEGAQPQEKVVAWAKEICSALEYLHSMNPPIIYRDMKPSNIMLKPNGKVKLIDFGTAKELDVKSLADTTALGTRGYAAPEQFGDEKGRGIHKTDARTDIYSLGATLYHLLTGKDPSEPPYVMKPIREWNANLSSGLEKIIGKCTMLNPEERYQTCSDLVHDLEHYEKLDDQYKRDCLFKMKRFLISLAFAISFGVISLIGYMGLEDTKRADYESLMKEGYSCTLQGDYKKAIDYYMDAIIEVDGSRSSAYIELMDLYINYLGEPEKGMDQVTYYINQGYQNIDGNQELLYEVAMNYFDLLKDYKTSAHYFNMMDKKKYPEADYFSTISLAMGEMNVDYKKLMDDLDAFEKLNDKQTVSMKKLNNYKLLCIVYARNLKQIDGADEKLIRVGNKALSVLENYENDGVKAEYYVTYHQYLAQGYQSLGEKIYIEDQNAARTYFEKAIKSCDFILGMVSANEESTIHNITDSKLREVKHIQKAEIYCLMQEYEQAIKVYEKAKEEYRYSSISIYSGYLSLLCEVEEIKTTNVENWDYELLHDLYKEGLKVPNIMDDYRWKQLTQKLSPLFEKNGG